MIFHQFQRYQTAKTAIEAVRCSPRMKILEVGVGSHGNLAQFFPDDDLLFTDLTPTSEALKDPRLAIADATALTYADDSFDFVVGLDMLEHVPEEKRPAYLRELLRVCRRGVFLSFPHWRVAGLRDDAIVGAEYEAIGSPAPIWVHEHCEHRLPCVQDCRDALKEQLPAERMVALEMVNTELMRRMLQLESLCSRYGSVRPFFDAVNEYYNTRILERDVNGPAGSNTKTCLMLCKDVDPDSVRRSFAAAPGEESAALIRELIAEIDRYLTLYLPPIMQKELLLPAPAQPPLLLTVLLITYNQSAYIEATLQTIFAQQTSFAFQILVADDCSTDDTCAKIRAMIPTAPVPITFLPSDHNLGVLKNYQRGFAACTTEFVAVMEGDDLWTDEHRLQKHVDCLRAHKECPMSFNRFLAANYEQSQFSVNPTIPNPENAPMLYVFGNDLARDNLIGNFSTCVYRTWAVQHIQPSVYKQNAYDWLFHIVLSGHGPIAYLPEVMSVYRVHANGTWSRLSAQERMQNLLDAIERYDAFTGGIYHEAFTEQKSRLSAIRIHELGRLSAPHSFNSRVRRVARACYRYMPPILVKIAKLFISPAAWNKLLSGLARILARIKGRNRNHDA